MWRINFAREKLVEVHGMKVSIGAVRTMMIEKNYRDTQFHRATKELGINLILALSPQANERIAVLANNWHKARGGRPNAGHPWKKRCPHTQPRATQAC